MNISKTSIAVRMNTYAMLALLSVLMIAGTSLSGVRELARSHEHSFGHAKAVMFAAEGSAMAAETYRLMTDAVLKHNPDESARNLDVLKVKARQLFDSLQASAETGEQKKLAGQAMQAHENMVTLLEQGTLPFLRQDHPNQSALASVNAEINTQGAIVKDALEKFSESMTQEAIAADKDFETAQSDIFMRDEGIATAVLLLLLATSWWITRSIIRQLGGEPHYVAEVMHKMAGGDITVNIRLAKGDRTSILVKAKEISDRFAQAILSIHKAERSLERAADQVSAMAQILSESTSQQAAEAIETSSSIEQMNVSICRNRKNANATDNMAVVTAKDVAEEKQAIKDTVCSMKNIAGKIDILSNLANQSKLLALDALVEAARAGQHGSRFKSVAEKMCELIERSQTVIKEVSGLSCNSVNMAGRAVQLIEKMEPKLIITSDLAQEVYCSSSEQSRGVAQINSAIVHLNQATQQNASASEQLAATAVEMNELTDQLHSAMTYFKLGKVVTPASNQARNAPGIKAVPMPGLSKPGFTRQAA